MRLVERFRHKTAQLRAAPLEQRALQRLFMGIFCDIDRLHGAGINAGVVHTGGQSSRGGIEVLHLLGLAAVLMEELCEGHCILQCGAGVRTHEIGNKVLLLLILFVDAAVLCPELFKHVEVGLAHVVQHAVHAMLGCHLQLTADVILHELCKKFAVFVLQHIVIADAAADEDLLHAGNGAQAAQKQQIIAVIGIKVLAGGGGETVAILAHTVLLLLFAAGMAEVGGGTAYVMDVALELGIAGEGFYLADDGFLTAAGDHAALMEGERAEVAAAEAATVVSNGETHLFNSGNTAEGIVHGMDFAHIGQLCHTVHFGRGKRQLGRIDHQILLAVALQQGVTTDGIMLLVFETGGEGILHLVGADTLKGGALDGVAIGAGIAVLGDESGAAHIGDGFHLFALGKTLCDLAGGTLAHTVGQKIRGSIEEDAATHLVVPVVIMGIAAQRRFETADHDGSVGERLSGEICVNDGGAVRTQTHAAAGTVRVLAAMLLGGSVVCDHGVDVAAADEHAVTGLAHGEEIGAVLPLGLGKKSDTVALALEKAGNDGGAEAGMVYIGIRSDHQKVIIVPAAFHHFLAADGKVLLEFHKNTP